ncbi:MAG: hypothetical protein HYX77_00625 [Acidobacteria bacterium]|nr:hypothetical protein [Acidobacteriota bacterium]
MKRFALFLACLGMAAGTSAQVLPSEPVTIGDGRVVIGGDVAVSIAPEDPGFFNYSDYEHSTLREFRLGVTASVRATDRISFLGEVRSENFGHVSPLALYARVRPFPNRRLDVQIGRIPPTFGAFTRRAYGRDNPLIGYPLAYQYLTSLRPDAVPATADELLRMRARGWLTNFSIGNQAADRGLPLVTAFRWDTGVQVTTAWRAVGLTASITNGSASNPRVADDNSGKQVAMRGTVTPVTGLVLGSSWTRGQFLSRSVMNAVAAGAPEDFVQRAYGLDVEYSRDRWLVRGDAVHSQWQLPLPSEPLAHGRLQALAVSVEGRYTILPGIYAAARAEHLAFSRIAGTNRVVAWDAPVSRGEIGGGYYLQRNVVARVSWQHNARDAGRVTRDSLVAAQLLFWF